MVGGAWSATPARPRNRTAPPGMLGPGNNDRHRNSSLTGQRQGKQNSFQLKARHKIQVATRPGATRGRAIRVKA